MNKKVLFIYHAAGHTGKIKAWLDNPGREGEPILVAFGGTEGELARHNLSCRTPAEYISEEDSARLEADALDFVKSLGSRKFSDDTSLVSFLEYERISLWWVSEGAFWRQVARDLVRFADTLTCLIDREKPDRMAIVNDDSLSARAAIAVGRARGIPVQTLSPGVGVRLKIALRPLWQGLRRQTIPWLRVARDMVRQNIARTNPLRQDTGKNKILLSAMMKGTMQELVTDGNGRTWRENLYLGPLISELREDGSNDIIYLYNISGPLRLRVPGDVKWPGVTVRPREYYLTWRTWRTVSAESRRLAGKWRLLKGSPTFREICRYRDIPMWDTLKDELRQLFDDHYPGFIRDIEVSKRLVEAEKPGAIVFADEASFTNKSLLVAAYPQKVPTLVVQTGVMAVNNEFLEYGCAGGELEGSPTKRPLIPDKFSVYGEATRDTMKEAGYPCPEGIEVTGQPRYDILARAGEAFDRERYCRRLNIGPEKKMALIAAQPSTTFANMEELLRAVLWALKDDPQITIVIKPKPGPSDAAEKQYEQLVAETGAWAVVLPRNADTNEALYACDVLITGYSTVALEAMALGKPVITVNLSGQPDVVPYAQHGAAIGVYSAGDIAPAVNRALNDPAAREGLARGREAHLYRQFYRLDGMATKRVAALIHQMIERKTAQKLAAGAK